MIIQISWQAFQIKFLMKDKIYVLETPTTYEFYSYDGPIEVKSVVQKSDNLEQNIFFVEKYFNGKSNIIKIEEILEPKPDEIDADPLVDVSHENQTMEEEMLEEIDYAYREENDYDFE